MGAWLLLAFGVCCALLCHWMIRHTYVDYEWVKLENPDKDGGTHEKVWNKRLQLPRWVYILLWVFCLGLFPVAVIVPIVLGAFLLMKGDTEGWKFIHSNKFISWFTKKV